MKALFYKSLSHAAVAELMAHFASLTEGLTYKNWQAMLLSKYCPSLHSNIDRHSGASAGAPGAAKRLGGWGEAGSDQPLAAASNRQRPCQFLC